MGLLSTLIRKIVKCEKTFELLSIEYIGNNRIIRQNLDQMRVIVLTRIMSGPALENAQTKRDDPMGRFVLPCKAKHCI